MTGANPEGPEQLQEILRRLERMEQRLGELQQQVDRATGHPAPAPPPPPPAPLPPRPPAPAAPPTIAEYRAQHGALPTEPEPPGAPAPPKPATPAPIAAPPPRPAPPTPLPTPAPRPAPAPPPTPPASEPALAEGWETEIALKWMGRIGIAALFFGIAFFLQYAFRNGWIGPWGQVLIGIATGVVLILMGLTNRSEDRQTLAEALMGGGLAILYLAFYAAYALYQPPLLGHLEAFGCMALITLLGALLALRKGSQAMAVLTTVGGFLTPMILHKAGGTGADVAAQYTSLLELFGYITILNLGLLGLSMVRQWRSLQILSFVGSWIIMWGWLGDLHGTALNLSTASAMAIVFAIYLLVPVVRNLWLRQPSRETDIVLILANPTCFFVTTVLLLWDTCRDYMGLYAAGLGVVYFLLGHAGHRRSPSDRLVFLSWIGLGIGLLILAVPLEYQGHWIMIGWGIEGLLLVWIGQQLRSQALRGVGLAMQTIVFGWLLLLYTLEGHDLTPPGSLPFLNPLFLSYLGGMAAIAATLLVFQFARPVAEEGPQAVSVLTYALAVLLLWGVSEEMTRLDWPSRYLMLYWGVEGVFLVWLGHRLRSAGLRGMGMVVQTVVFGWLLMLYEIDNRLTPSLVLPFLNPLFLPYLGGVVTLALALLVYLYAKPAAEERPQIITVMTFGLAATILWGVTAEMHRLHWDSGYLMLWWAAGSLAMLLLGLKRLGTPVAVAGLVLQGAVAVWLLTVYEHRPQPGMLPLANTVFLCFAMGVIALGMGLALLLADQKTRHLFAANLTSVYVVAISFLSVWGLTAETLRSLHWLSSDPAYHAYAGVTGFAVSILWCLCAGALIAVGMVLRYPLPRQLGVILFGVAIAKVFLYDSSALETIWRVLSFVCLGVILIAVSYLYHLYRERVKEFIGGGPAEE